MSRAENGGEMTALSKDGGPAFGTHAFIWAGEWTREGAERVISGAAGVGLDFVEIPLLDPGSIDVEHTRSLLDRYGLGCSCSLGLPAEIHLPSNPEGARRFLDGAVETTAALGSPVLTGCLYTHVGTLTGKPPEPSELQAVAHVLKRTARRAAEYGVELGIEAINRYETYLVNLALQAGELLDRRAQRIRPPRHVPHEHRREGLLRADRFFGIQAWLHPPLRVRPWHTRDGQRSLGRGVPRPQGHRLQGRSRDGILRRRERGAHRRDGAVARRGRGPRRPRSGRACLPAREGKGAWCALMKENRSSQGQA